MRLNRYYRGGEAMINYMKIFNYVLFGFLLLCTSSCLEYKVTTIIKPDGSCERIVVTKSKKGQGEFKKRGVSINFDETWKTYEENIEPDSIIGLASKQFASVADMNEELKKISKYREDVELKKEFRWFYSYLIYTETYYAMNPYNNILIEDFLSREELDDLKRGEIGDSLKTRLRIYDTQNAYIYFLDSLESLVKEKGFDEIDVSILRDKKDEFINKMIIETNVSFPEYFMKYVEELLGTKQIWSLEQNIKELEKRIEKNEELIIFGDYTNEVVVPGLLINTNANNIEGNKVTWNFNSLRFSYLDYKMVVKSRVTNVWAMIVTASVVVLLVLLLIAPKIRRRNIV